ncbi:MAG TPA: adenylyl-sulfate kinase [Methylococcaceae bacterium]|nr:adenylyl-sulfate kinase [Methylococcaceae bacterium]
MDTLPQNLIWHRAGVTREQREKLNGHRGAILWFTGLSGAGKSTLAHATEEFLHERGCRTFVLDGDNVRHGLCSDLGFSEQDRAENIRRIGEMAALFLEAGLIVLAAFISPARNHRTLARSLAGKGDFLEIFCRCPIQVCEERDVKGLYQRARKGEIGEFTGVSAPYEAPENADLVIDTHRLSIDDAVRLIAGELKNRGITTIDV